MWQSPRVDRVCSKKPYLRLLLSGLLLGITIASCAPAPSTTTPLPSPWLSKWLQQPTCDPPCWESIVPGTSVLGDAVSLLETSPDVENLRGPSPGYRGEQYIAWSFKSSDSSGEIVADDSSLLVKTINLCLGKSDKRLAQDIISTRVQPTSIVVMQTQAPTYFSISLLDQTRGTLLRFGAESSSRTEVKISPDAKVNCIVFYPLGMEKYVIHSLYMNSLIPWRGFTTYKIITP